MIGQLLHRPPLRLAMRPSLEEQFRVSAWRELPVAPFSYDTKT